MNIFVPGEQTPYRLQSFDIVVTAVPHTTNTSLPQALRAVLRMIGLSQPLGQSRNRRSLGGRPA